MFSINFRLQLISLLSGLTFAVSVSAQNVELEEAFPSLNFIRPVLLTHGNDGSNRIFVVEQRGVIRVFTNQSNIAATATFLDIQDRVNDSRNEMGLLGLAFHPDYVSNGLFYVNYTTGDNSQRRTVVAGFRVSVQNADSADINSEAILMEVNQPFTNHNGGMLAFGPEGNLYIGLGDGGSGGDPRNSGQDRSTLLGSILRIDVDNAPAGLNYVIPADNPFTGNTEGFREEIYAYGLRNPWRFSIDHQSGQIWAGDVGQNDFEEIDLIESGGNYGWRIMEGLHCFNPSSGCDMTGLTLPLVEYPHFDANQQFMGCSVTGGYVYRGTLRPDLEGAYLYGDFCTGSIWMLRYENGSVIEAAQVLDGNDPDVTSVSIGSFGVDESNELYILALDIGKIFKFKELISTVDDEADNLPVVFGLSQNYPNPFNPETTIRYTLAKPENVEIVIFNQSGQQVRTLVDEFKAAGNYQITWDGKGDHGHAVASGVYFYRVRTPGPILETKRMLLLR